MLPLDDTGPIPWSIKAEVAPVVLQVNVACSPELILAGLTEKTMLGSDGSGGGSWFVAL